jgi:NitT/TauT family transport system substrate-binding protein
VIRRAATALLAGLVLAACGGSGGGASPSGSPAKELRLGYFANVTHATPVVGVAKGVVAKDLGSTKLTTQVFNAGPAAMEALFAGSIDAAYVGPNPAVNAYIKSRGEALRLIAGATSGGAELVVKPSIASPSQLKGTKLATPQLGNTQDVALRYWLSKHGMRTDSTGGGDVSVQPSDNATIVTAFKAGQIDGAWVPEPYASRLVLEGGGKVLLDERDLWPRGQFVTTTLAVSATFLQQHPQTVEALLRGQVDANDWIAAHPADAAATVNAQLGKLSGKPLPGPVMDRAWSEIAVTNDPLAATLRTSADHAVAVGLLKKPDLKGIYEVAPLNRVLAERKRAPVDASGLGRA